jgi:hypothetical protein
VDQDRHGFLRFEPPWKSCRLIISGASLPDKAMHRPRILLNVEE